MAIDKTDIANLIRSWDGPLTRELVREPGRFGLGQVPSRLAPDRTTTAVCGFCSTGCGLDIHLKKGEAVNLSPSSRYPVNRGMACPKGWEALAPLDAPDRAVSPLLRDASGALREVGWETGVGEMVRRFKSILSEQGGDALAFLSTGQIPTEEMVFLGSLAKFGMGMHHGDGNTRQCMATAVTAYKQSFGFDAPPYSYEDFEQSDVIVLVGSNLCVAHPIMWERVCRNPNSPELVVVDPRSTETAQAATQHYAIEPKSDLWFFYAVANELIAKGWIDRETIDAHTAGFDEFAATVASFTPEAVAERTGIEPSAIRTLAETIHRGERVSFWWTMGVNQGHQATRTAQALINLALMTGNIGRPGTGANSITGQCNAMGSRLFSNTTSLFCGREYSNPEHRQEVADILGIEESCIPREDCRAYDQIIDGIREGRIRGLWVVATNTAHSWIDQSDVRELLSKLDFLVVQDMYSTTETAQLADLVLPAAGWGEKEGTFINSERRIGLLKKVKRAPGQALADFQIFRLVASMWGCGEMFERWKTPEDVFASMKELSRGRPCDVTGIEGYDRLDVEGGIQWPLREGQELASNARRLFEDGRFYHSDARARFRFEEPREPGEKPDREYPFVLLTGRGSSSQWHTQTRTAKSATLEKLHPGRLPLQISPLDAEKLGLSNRGTVRVRSRRGELEASVRVTPGIRPGQLFLPMHDEETNRLTFASFDPDSRQPSYKYAAVRLDPAEPAAEG